MKTQLITRCMLVFLLSGATSVADDNILEELIEPSIEQTSETPTPNTDEVILTEITPDNVILPPVVTSEIAEVTSPPQTKTVLTSTFNIINKYISFVIRKYKVHPTLAEQVVTYAHKYEKTDFPKAEHILAVIGIESKFKTNTKSRLSFDPAEGLMQIRPIVWAKVIPKKALLTTENQVKYGALILSMYYKQTGRDIDNTIVAYNIGIGSLQRGNYNNRYLRKYKKELARFRTAITI